MGSSAHWFTLYGVNGTTLTAIDDMPLPWRIEAGKLTKAIDFILEPDEWRIIFLLRELKSMVT